MKSAYAAPVDDYVFLLHQESKIHERRDLPDYADNDAESTRAILGKPRGTFSVAALGFLALALRRRTSCGDPEQRSRSRVCRPP
jgi:hypothetical protein